MNTRHFLLLALLTASGLVLPLGAQIVNDGATRTLSNVTNTFTGDVTVGTNGSFTLLILSENSLLTNSAQGVIGRNATARSNEVQLTSASARWRMGGSLLLDLNGAANRLTVSESDSFREEPAGSQREPPVCFDSPAGTSGAQQSHAGRVFALRGRAFVTICDNVFLVLCENVPMSGELQTLRVAASRTVAKAAAIPDRLRIPSLAPTLPLLFNPVDFCQGSPMSKAFTRESDDAPELPSPPRPLPVLPPGARNYITPGGAQRLREELERLTQVERPGLASASADVDAKQALVALDRRIAQLEQSLRTVVIASPPDPPWDQVRFGATVTVRDRNGAEDRFRIVGMDETDFDRDWVSWLSPIAKALLNARIGQCVRFRVPAGEREVEVIGVTYE